MVIHSLLSILLVIRWFYFQSTFLGTEQPINGADVPLRNYSHSHSLAVLVVTPANSNNLGLPPCITVRNINVAISWVRLRTKVFTRKQTALNLTESECQWRLIHCLPGIKARYSPGGRDVATGHRSLVAPVYMYTRNCRSVVTSRSTGQERAAGRQTRH